MFSSTTYYNSSSYGDKKTYNLRIIVGLEPSNILVGDTYRFFNTIKVIEHDFIDYYHVFIEEVKSLSENRDSKIDEVMS